MHQHVLQLRSNQVLNHIISQYGFTKILTTDNHRDYEFSIILHSIHIEVQQYNTIQVYLGFVGSMQIKFIIFQKTVLRMLLQV